MIDKSKVSALVNEWLEGRDYFLVTTEVTTDNRIVVEIDHADGVWIDDCVALSRFIEDHLNRDDEDYELEVGSAGIGQPLKVKQQYINSIGKEVEVMTPEGRKLKGILTRVDGDRFTLKTQEKQRLEGKKRPEMVDVERDFGFNEVKYTKQTIIFK